MRELEGVVANYSAAGIPLDTIWSDIDYMHGWRDFTLDPDNFSAPDMRVRRPLTLCTNPTPNPIPNPPKTLLRPCPSPRA